MQDIEDREDVMRLIVSFYTRVKEDELLAPVFLQVVTDWPAHFELLTDFWETNLFFKPVYKGHPHRVHVAVDQQTGSVITPEYFGRWLQIWFSTIDELFSGPRAEAARLHAQKMSTMMYMKIWQGRQSDSTSLL